MPKSRRASRPNRPEDDGFSIHQASRMTSSNSSESVPVSGQLFSTTGMFFVNAVPPEAWI